MHTYTQLRDLSQPSRLRLIVRGSQWIVGQDRFARFDHLRSCSFSVLAPFSWFALETRSGGSDRQRGRRGPVHNINHFEGPGQLPNFYYRFLQHLTLDRATGELKVDVWKEDLLCK